MRRLTFFILVIGFLLLVTPVVFAEIQLYGAARLSVDVIDDDVERNLGMSSNISDVGVKGGHQINESIRGFYQLEVGFDLTGETSSLFARPRFIGLEGKLGRILFGSFYNLFSISARNYDVFYKTIGDARGVFGLSAAGVVQYDRIIDNTMTYFSPKFKGIQLALQYSTAYRGGQTASGSDDNNERLSGLSLIYTSGALSLQGVYETHHDDNSDGIRLTGKYKFDKATLGVVFETLDAGSGNSLSRDAYGVNFAYPLSFFVLKGQVLKADDYDGVTDSGATNFSLGAFKELDEYFTIYILYSKTENEANAKYTLASVGHNGDLITPISPGDDIQAVSIGSVYVFN